MRLELFELDQYCAAYWHIPCLAMRNEPDYEILTDTGSLSRETTLELDEVVMDCWRMLGVEEPVRIAVPVDHNELFPMAVWEVSNNAKPLFGLLNEEAEIWLRKELRRSDYSRLAHLLVSREPVPEDEDAY